MTILLAFLSVPVASAQDKADQQRVYLVGNSLTWDTVPTKLDGYVKYHVDCGKSLPYIVENPDEPCVKSSSLWPQTLPNESFDIISLQIHYGSTVEADVAAIQRLIENQQAATIVIHTGWARSAEWQTEWSQELKPSAGAKMQHHPDYFSEVLSRLRMAHPKRTFQRTLASDALAIVQDDIESGSAPISELPELYRDKIHMNVVTGRYLMHNVMRQALGQPRSQVGFEKLTPSMKQYLDSVLDRLPSATTASID